MSVLSKALGSVRNGYGGRGLATAVNLEQLQHRNGKSNMRGDYVPVYVALGLILVSTTLGLNTARLQLAHAPNVFVDKKKRETVPEVAIPDWSLEEAERFLDKSVFRKVAHLQDFDDVRTRHATATATATATKKAETLKDVGVEPPGIDETRGSRFRQLLANLTGTGTTHN